MNIQIFGRRKCFDSKKAERFFKERGIKYQFIDLDIKGMSAGELKSVISAVGGINGVINEKSKDYCEIKYLLEEAKFDKLLEKPSLLNSPIVRNGKKATVGCCISTWEEWKKE